MFTDILGKWYEKIAIRAARLNLIRGYPDGTFKGDNFLTRAEGAAIAINIHDIEKYLVKEAHRAIVKITNMQDNSLGSGTHIGQGYILTNDHVIGSPKSVMIEYFDDNKVTVSNATTVFSQPNYDLAILRDTETKNHARKALKLCPSGKVEQGQKVSCIGSPLGLSNTATFGHVSNDDRYVNYYGQGQNWKSKLYQVDAPINPGNSGGACINYKGELIGVPSAGIPGRDGLGFVIKVESILEFIESAYDQELNNVILGGLA